MVAGCDSDRTQRAACERDFVEAWIASGQSLRGETLEGFDLDGFEGQGLSLDGTHVARRERARRQAPGAVARGRPARFGRLLRRGPLRVEPLEARRATGRARYPSVFVGAVFDDCALTDASFAGAVSTAPASGSR